MSDVTDTAEPRAMRADAVRNRAKIVDAAKAAFGERGLDVQMEDVARAAGVGVGTLYRHFPTKEALVRALIVDKMERMSGVARAALEDESVDAWEAFAGVLRKGAEQQVADRALTQVVASQPAAVFEQTFQQQTQLGAHMGALLARAQRAGAVRPDAKPEDIPMVMCGMAAVVQNGRDWERYLELMLDGFRAGRADRLSD